MSKSDKSMLVNCERAKWQMLRQVEDLFREHGHVTFTWRTGKQRTLTQNASLHLWLGWLAKALNDAGLDMRRTLRQDVDIPWTMESAKEFLWRPIQAALLNKASTTEAERTDYAYVEQVLSKHLVEKFPGIQIPEWPDKHKLEDQRRRA